MRRANDTLRAPFANSIPGASCPLSLPSTTSPPTPLMGVGFLKA